MAKEKKEGTNKMTWVNVFENIIIQGGKVLQYSLILFSFVWTYNYWVDEIVIRKIPEQQYLAYQVGNMLIALYIFWGMYKGLVFVVDKCKEIKEKERE